MRSLAHAMFLGGLGVAIAATVSASAAAQIDPQPASSPVAHYGTGGAGTGGIAPTLTTNGVPRIGSTTWEVQAENVVGGSWGVLLYSTTGQDIPVPGLGRAYVLDPAIWPTLFSVDGTPGAAGAGTASIQIQIPASPALIGATYYGQAFFSDSQAAAGGGITHTAGMRVSFAVRSLINSRGMEFARIPAGTFMMGSPATESLRDNDENQFQVTLTQPFWMQTTEVTQGQWQAVMGSNPSHWQGTNLPVGESGAARPVESVSHAEVQSFLTMLNSLDPTFEYRLPTEAEWEWACRAGTTTAYPFADSATAGELDPYGWYWDYYDGATMQPGTSAGVAMTREVMTKAPNAYGLYDMHGNVMEWCEDYYYHSYPTTPQTNPVATTGGTGTGRVHRGGSFNAAAKLCRSANREGGLTSYARRNYIGFRLVRTKE